MWFDSDFSNAVRMHALEFLLQGSILLPGKICNYRLVVRKARFTRFTAQDLYGRVGEDNIYAQCRQTASVGNPHPASALYESIL